MNGAERAVEQAESLSAGSVRLYGRRRYVGGDERPEPERRRFPDSLDGEEQWRERAYLAALGEPAETEWHADGSYAVEFGTINQFGETIE